MIPIAGSAYTYSYATMGELMAWIIGWDLVLEYAVGARRSRSPGAATSSVLLHGFGIDLPTWMPRRAVGSAPTAPSSTCPPCSSCSLIMLLLVVGVRRVARVNA